MQITSYQFGKIEIDGKTYEDDIVITPTGVRPGWWRKSGHEVSLFDLAVFLDPKPARLIIGTGANGKCQVLPEVRGACETLGIELIAAPTPEAVGEFNALTDEERAQTVCALHLTC